MALLVSLKLQARFITAGNYTQLLAVLAVAP
jgi:hypothetical protein